MNAFYDRIITYIDEFAEATYEPDISRPKYYYIATGQSGPTLCVKSDRSPASYDSESYFYCPPDQAIYIGQDQLWSYYGGHGDAGAAVAIVHEWGHHLQLALWREEFSAGTVASGVGRLPLAPCPENGVRRQGRWSILAGVAVHPPRRRQLLPPSPQEQAYRAEQAAAWRAELDRRDAELRPARLAAVCTGPPVRNPDAAADCRCSCHPKPADTELHDGGLSCGCQLTPHERRQAWEEFTEQLDSLDLDADIRSGEAELARQAQELGVTAQWRLVAAPFVITGNVDGRGFYLRERHGYYRITIAPDDDPAADPWELPAERATLDIADGEDDDLTGPDGGYDVAHTLTVAVHAVRTFLTRRQCEHQQPTDPRHLFCSWCGVQLAEADTWTAEMDAEHGEPTVEDRTWPRQTRPVSSPRPGVAPHDKLASPG